MRLRMRCGVSCLVRPDPRRSQFRSGTGPPVSGGRSKTDIRFRSAGGVVWCVPGKTRRKGGRGGVLYVHRRIRRRPFTDHGSSGPVGDLSGRLFHPATLAGFLKRMELAPGRYAAMPVAPELFLFRARLLWFRQRPGQVHIGPTGLRVRRQDGRCPRRCALARA